MDADSDVGGWDQADDRLVSAAAGGLSVSGELLMAEILIVFTDQKQKQSHEAPVFTG